MWGGQVNNNGGFPLPYNPSFDHMHATHVSGNGSQVPLDTQQQMLYNQYHSMPSNEVDWASLAQQWISLKNTSADPGHGVGSHHTFIAPPLPSAFPPPSNNNFPTQPNPNQIFPTNASNYMTNYVAQNVENVQCFPPPPNTEGVIYNSEKYRNKTRPKPTVCEAPNVPSEPRIESVPEVNDASNDSIKHDDGDSMDIEDEEVNCETENPLPKIENFSNGNTYYNHNMNNFHQSSHTASVPNLMSLPISAPPQARVHGYFAPKMDEASLKKLPPWIRDGIARMEKEKSKKEQAERDKVAREERLNAKREEMESSLKEEVEFKSFPSKSKFENSDDEDNAATSVPGDLFSKRESSSEDETPNVTGRILLSRTSDDALADRMFILKRTLTQILLDVTGSGIQSNVKKGVVDEVRLHARKVNKQPKKLNNLANIEYEVSSSSDEEKEEELDEIEDQVSDVMSIDRLQSVLVKTKMEFDSVIQPKIVAMCERKEKNIDESFDKVESKPNGECRNQSPPAEVRSEKTKQSEKSVKTPTTREKVHGESVNKSSDKSRRSRKSPTPSNSDDDEDVRYKARNSRSSSSSGCDRSSSKRTKRKSSRSRSRSRRSSSRSRYRRSRSRHRSKRSSSRHRSKRSTSRHHSRRSRSRDRRSRDRRHKRSSSRRRDRSKRSPSPKHSSNKSRGRSSRRVRSKSNSCERRRSRYSRSSS